jgi:membrane fusion protein, heavy metal efflux system
MKNKIALFTTLMVFAAGLAVISQWACKNGPESSFVREESASPRSDSKSKLERSEQIVRLTDAQMKEFGIKTESAGPGNLRMEIVLPGEVVLNSDRVAHVVPRVSGVVREVRKNLGDSVREGEIMAVLESRELADITAALLAARERVILAQSNFVREEQVWAKKISPEQDYIQAKNRLAEATIELHAAEQRLRALGFSNEYIEQLPNRKDESTILYQIAAPFGGTVMEKHISLGEVLKDESTAFVIADLSTVWVNLDVQQKDLSLIKVGQSASIGIGNDPPSLSGQVSFLEPTATETNRTIHARVVIPNAEGKLRPGLFVNGRIVLGTVRIPVLVPNDALAMVDGQTCLFVKENEGFRLQPARVGRTDGSRSEILEGLDPGQLYASKGSFTLKSELQKPETE